MKVQYIVTHVDEYGQQYEPGWVAEHTDGEGARRIAQGLCVEVDSEARAFKYKIDAPLSIDECVPPKSDELPEFQSPKIIGKK